MIDILLVMGCIVLVCAVIAGFSGAPWVPARQKDVAALLDELGPLSNKTVIELGCGDGRLVVAAARVGATVYGYEINPLLYGLAKIRCLPYKKAIVKFGNFWQIDISQADVVIAFLVPRTMSRIAKKVAQEMKHGSVFVSYIFAIPNRKVSRSKSSWLFYSN